MTAHPCYPRMELHVSLRARQRYGFDDLLFSLTGNVIFANLQAVRRLVDRINAERDALSHPEQAVRPGEVNAVGLIDELLHHLVARYRQERQPVVMAEAVDWLSEQHGRERVDATLLRFLELFPTTPVLRGEVSAEEYLEGETGGVPHRQVVLEELLLLWLANQNPAFAPLRELFDDVELEASTGYRQLVAALEEFFAGQPRFPVAAGEASSEEPEGERGASLFDLLQEVIRRVPHSLGEQLRFLLDRWGDLPERQVTRVLTGLDVIKEEQRPFFAGAPMGGGGVVSAPPPVYEYSALEHEEERFSADRDWMPEVVLMAKNTYVWLDQLSRAYQRPITRLDEIPDAELDRLAGWGFTSLWLVGLWQRSAASAQIKQLCGNPEAAASAYAVDDYRIADLLGGEAACADLRARALARGIRLACDMVPNHMGLDSRWVLEHPELFLTVPESPYPSYRFDGPELSPDPAISLRLEDHYYDRSDAAVVFRRQDLETGAVSYVYHGNDGTSLPWNDTAQLDYLNPEAREAVIAAIVAVARDFPVIRFDAAMTLAKRHVQRLWFPPPGQGGAIPSRSEHGLSGAEFDRRMPEEFWREVVDRVAAEVPDTLLLAEAFWLMEGYFVRSLGMHRVYNSAFMHMLREEQNEKFRASLANTLEFDPEVMKRFVNYVTTPDEVPAVVQLGSGEKYFGICALLATLPGLPMFGHGQFEGLREKYGMEYRRAYSDEQPHPHLIERHEREIVPLLRRRYLFAEVAQFRLYDFVTASGVDHDVYAFTNGLDDERVVVLYHNAAGTTRGRIRRSLPWRQKDEGEGRLVTESVAEALQVEGGADRFCLFRDLASGLEFLRASAELAERGLYAELGPYQRRVLVDLRQVRDEHGHYRRLAESLHGHGVPDLAAALRELTAQPVQAPVRELLAGDLLQRLLQAAGGPAGEVAELLDEVADRYAALLADLAPELRRDVPEGAVDEASDETAAAGSALDPPALAARVRRQLAVLLDLSALLQGPAPLATLAARVLGLMARVELSGSAELEETAELEWSTLGFECPPEPVPPVALPSVALPPAMAAGLPETPDWYGLLTWVLVHPLGRLLTAADPGATSRELLDRWQLDRAVAGALVDLGVETTAAARQAVAVKLFTRYQRWFEPLAATPPEPLLASWLRDDEVRRFLYVHRFDGVEWFQAEAYEQWQWWLAAVAGVTLAAEEAPSAGAAAAAEVLARLEAAVEVSEYRLARLAEALGLVSMDEVDEMNEVDAVDAAPEEPYRSIQ